MKIERIRIKNFKGIEDKQFVLNPRFTVFIGENASGKTTVLDALTVAIGSFLVGIQGVNSRPIDQKEIRLISIDGQPRPQKPVIIEAEGEIDNHPLPPWRREILNRKTTTSGTKPVSDIAAKKLLLSRTPKKERAGEEVIFPVVAYHGTGRLWAEHEAARYMKQEEGVVKAYNNALSAKSSSKDFISWYVTQEDSIKKFGDELDVQHLNAFKKIILAMIPDGRWQEIEFDHKADSIVGVFTGLDGRKTKLAYSQLSDGYRNIIGIAADIAYRCIQLNPHLGEEAVVKTPGIVLIDELDLHLHPKWQKIVVDQLKNTFPEIQFVATTHSPFIIQSLKEDELINLDALFDRAVPNEMSLSKVVTEIMNVKSIRSDDFDRRVMNAKIKLDEIHKQNGELTVNDYSKIRAAITENLLSETDDPEFKAFLLAKKDREQSE